MWTILILAAIICNVLVVETKQHYMSFYGPENFLSRPMRPFWHLENRGRVMEKVLSGLNLRRSNRDFGNDNLAADMIAK
ncbi:hypothetical protein Q1695_005919 [Nippostrongylus brasiliensis]|nr:hypothetical protein Q1695_005919 [Nippostrongylus brasiliensis]